MPDMASAYFHHRLGAYPVSSDNLPKPPAKMTAFIGILLYNNYRLSKVITIARLADFAISHVLDLHFLYGAILNQVQGVRLSWYGFVQNASYRCQ